MTRSEAARLAGLADFAQADLSAALDRDPLNPRANRKALEADLCERAPGAARTLRGGD